MDNRAYMMNELKRTLKWIERVDSRGDQDLRNKLIFRALYLALAVGLNAGVKFDPNEPTMPVVHIDLPNNTQVSWHVPEYKQR